MIYTLAGREIGVSFGMLLIGAMIKASMGKDLDGPEYFCTVLYEADKAYAKINDVAPVFKSINEVFSLYDAEYLPGSDFQQTLDKLVNDFHESQAYQSVIKATEETSDKKK
jgi:hypothetical protein